MRRDPASTWGLWASLWLTALCVGCEVDTFCLDCPASDDGAAGPGVTPPVDAEDGGGQGGGSFDPMDAGADAGPRICMRSAEELCNGFDDDCDKIVDEGFDLDADPRHCGQCGNACAPPNADGYCESGECEMGDCFDGFADLSDDEPGCEHRCEVFPVRGESCNGLDDDCDGVADEADGLPDPPDDLCKDTAGTPCEGTRPICTERNGVTGWYCDYGDAVEFDPAIPNGIAPEETRCDGEDGDCDGVADDSFAGLGTPCSQGTGACLSSGERVCSDDGTAVVCDAQEPADPGDEVCNGRDDDCDGDVDEDLGTQDMVRVSRDALDFWIDVHEASRPSAGSALSCAAAARDPWVNVTHAEAAAACAAAGKRLCTEAEWQMACEANPDDGTATTYPYGDVFDPERCNVSEYDPDCTGPDDDEILPTGTPHGCPAPASTGCVSAFGVVDMSGNAREWTATQVSDAPQTFRIRGGSAGNIATGVTCDFDFGLAEPDFAFENLGFRCCKDP